MKSINLHTITGNVGRDPYYKPGHGNSSFIAFSVATSTSWKDKNDEWKEKTQWHNVKIFGKLADKLSSALAKGTPVFVSGRHEYETKTGKDGKERNDSYILADNVYVLVREEAEPGQRKAGGAQRRKDQQDSAGPMGTADDLDDAYYSVGGGDEDIPF
jgi:single-strand DNA-binding protein